MAREFGRTARIADFLKKELSVFIQQEMRDPRVSMVSITDVEVSRDLTHAKVYVTVLGCDDADMAKEPVKVLNGAAGFLRSLVAKQSTMRITPSLRFYYDESLSRANRIDDLLNSDRQDSSSS